MLILAYQTKKEKGGSTLGNGATKLLIKEGKIEKNSLALILEGRLNGSTAFDIINYLLIRDDIEKITIDDSQLKTDNFGIDVLKSKLPAYLMKKIEFKKIRL